MRRLKNTSRELETDVITDILRDYMSELALGGYSIEWRKDILKSAVVGHRKLWELELERKGHINRPEKATQTKRRVARLVGKAQWFKKTQKQRGP